MKERLTRLRSHKTFMGKYVLVLQIGVRAVTEDHDDIQPSGRGVEFIEWRDAKVEDLAVAGLTGESDDN